MSCPRLPAAVSWCLASALLLLSVGTGCASKPQGVFGQTRATLAQTDDFGLLLVSAGLLLEELPRDADITVQEAGRLRLLLSLASQSMRGFGPSITADYLLAEVVTKGKTVSRATLNARVGRFQSLAVLRPDGYIVTAMTGRPLVCAGPVGVKDGALRAGDYRLGAFYTQGDQGFREVTSLPRLTTKALFLEASGAAAP